VSRLGGNTYQANVVDHTVTGAKVAALETAKSTCADAQREVLLSNVYPAPQGILYTCAVTFQCLKHGDPALLNPTYATPPDAVIEDNR
jgi:hypothetical protein